MATVVVKSDVDQSILMRETVLPDHLDSEQSAVQFLERLNWAIHDEDAGRRTARAKTRRQADAARRERHRFSRR